MNPGSVSIPKEQSPRGYLIWDEGSETPIVFRTLQGETWKTVSREELAK